MVIEAADPARLRASLRASLPHPVVDAIEAIADAAAPGIRLYAVGGSVRDLLLGRPIADLDLVTNTDAIALLGAALPHTRITGHRRFGTATAVVAGTRIDVATARTEMYARPGALPATTSAPIEADLRRRDFTCNAIALRLDVEAELLDPAGGIADIAGDADPRPPRSVVCGRSHAYLPCLPVCRAARLHHRAAHVVPAARPACRSSETLAANACAARSS